MTVTPPPSNAPDSARYAIYGEIASGGMATIQYGRLLGGHGFARAVAIKRLHPQYARDRDVVAMFIDEARLSARLAHANIVPTLDVIEGPSELAIVMEYVHGESLAVLLDTAWQRGQQVAIDVVVALISGALHGLHAAHEACDEDGAPLNIVHRDVSPQNILVGTDGVPRVADFGIAKAAGRLRSTPHGEIKGKLVYMAPEQLIGADESRQVDVYGAAAVLWEALTGRALFEAANESAVVHRVLYDDVVAPSTLRADVPPAIDRIVLRGLERDPAARFATARELARALEAEVAPAAQSRVAEWVQSLAGERLAARVAKLRSLQERETQVAVGMGFAIERARTQPRADSPWPAPAPASARESRETSDAGMTSAPARRRRAFAGWLVGGSAALLAGWGLAWFAASRGATQSDLKAAVAPAPPHFVPHVGVPAGPALAETLPGESVPSAAVRSVPAPRVDSSSPKPASTAPGTSRSLQLTAAKLAEFPSAPKLRRVAPEAPQKQVSSSEPSGLGSRLRAKERAPGALPARRAPAPNPPAAPVHLQPSAATPAAPERSAPPVECQPPYSVDRQGIRRLKPECL